MKQVLPYKVNKQSYLKPGARASKSVLEHKLFENLFEICLKEDYEDHYKLRDLERGDRLSEYYS